jgi:Phage tail protein
MTVIAGGAQAEAVRYAGQDLKSLGLYAEVNDGIASSPPVRGSNIVIPYQSGQRWVQKFYDERIVVLTGEMFSTVSRADFYNKLDQLKALFPLGAGEQKLEVQRQDGGFRYIMAEVRNTLGFQHLVWPPKSSAFSIELVASDPLWYSSALEANQSRQAWALDSGISFDDGAHWFDQTNQAFLQVTTGDPTTVEASNSGTAPVRKVVLSLAGTMVNPKIVNLRNGLSLQVNKSFQWFETLLIDCGAQALSLDGGGPYPLGILSLGAGQTDWMRLEPGENSLVLTLGGWPVTYQAFYSAAYL